MRLHFTRGIIRLSDIEEAQSLAQHYTSQEDVRDILLGSSSDMNERFRFLESLAEKHTVYLGRHWNKKKGQYPAEKWYFELVFEPEKTADLMSHALKRTVDLVPKITTPDISVDSLEHFLGLSMPIEQYERFEELIGVGYAAYFLPSIFLHRFNARLNNHRKMGDTLNMDAVRETSKAYFNHLYGLKRI